MDQAEKYGVNPDMLFAIRDKGERSGSSAVSPKGAVGRWQFMPATAKQYDVNPLDDNSGATGAAKFMSDIINKYKKQYPGLDERQYEAAAVAYYNGGGKAGQAVLQGKQPPALETQKYLKNTGYAGDIKPNTPTPSKESGGNDLAALLSDYGIGKESSSKSSGGNDLAALLADYSSEINPVSQPTTQQNNTTQTNAIDQTFKRRGLFGESDVGDTGFTGDTGVESPSSRVFKDAAIRGVTAGMVQPNIATPQERSSNFGASMAGSLFGSLPYAAVGGGIAAMAPKIGSVVAPTIMGARGATQTGMEGGSKSAIVASGALEGAAPAIGGAITRGIGKLGSKLLPYVTPPLQAENLLQKSLFPSSITGSIAGGIKDTATKSTLMGAAGQAIRGDISGAVQSLGKTALMNSIKRLPESNPTLNRNLYAMLPEGQISRETFADAYAAAKSGAGQKMKDLFTKGGSMSSAKEGAELDALKREGAALFDNIQLGKAASVSSGKLLGSAPSYTIRESENRDRINKR